MSGTKKGGKRAAATTYKTRGADFYKRIGAMGGKASTTGGFGHPDSGHALACRAGKIGGQNSKRTFTQADRDRYSEIMQEVFARKQRIGLV